MQLMINNQVISPMWLKKPGDKVFHAYMSTETNTAPLCLLGSPIVDMSDMTLPGDRSPCCLHCLSRITGFFPSNFPKQKK